MRIRCAAARFPLTSPGQPFRTTKWRSASPQDGYSMNLAKDVITVVPTLLLSAVAVLGMAVLMGLSVWDLPIRPVD